MTLESDKAPVMAYIKASLPLLTVDELEEAADAVLKEVNERKKRRSAKTSAERTSHKKVKK